MNPKSQKHVTMSLTVKQYRGPDNWNRVLGTILPQVEEGAPKTVLIIS